MKAPAGHEARPARARNWLIAFLSVWIAASVYAYAGIDRGLVPHDGGQFFQAAARAKAGEIPHRDFDEMYTGGLTYLNAFALGWLDETLISLRIVLLFFFVLWVPAVFYLASRFGPPSMAAAVTLLAVVWSVPNYPAPVPSWYNLFFATFGVAAVTRYIETGRRRWLFAAGLCGGLSVLIKLVGLYFVAGVLLFLLFREQSRAWDGEGPRRAPFYSVAISFGLVAFAAAVASAVGPAPTLNRVMLFFVPSGAVALTLLLREARIPPGTASARIAALWTMAGPFLGGAALPLAVFALFFAANGAWADLYHGVFVAPRRRLQFASMPPPALDILCAPILLLAATAFRRAGGLRTGELTVIAAGLLSVLLLQSASIPTLYQMAWRPLLFMLGVVTLVWVLPLCTARGVDQDAQKGALLLFVTATCSLVQYPFAASIYFCYVAPLIALSLAAVSSGDARGPHPLAKVLLVFYFLFAVFRVTPGFIYIMGLRYEPDRLIAKVSLRRARGLRVFPQQARAYDRIAMLLSRHAGGRPIYAFPDAPEIYVLAEMPNPTPTIYEFLSSHPITDEVVLGRLARHDVGAIVIKRPVFSSPPSPLLVRELRARFPMGEMVGSFEVRWRK